MGELKLVFPNKEYELKAKQFIDECKLNDSKVYGACGLDTTLYYDDWLQKISNYSLNICLPIDDVPQTVYFAIRIADNALIGVIVIRHNLNDWYLNYGGQIGYTIKPSERNKGYAKKILNLSLSICKKLELKRVLLCCDKTNIWSAQAIIKNSGILENEVLNTFNNKIIQRYWIDIY